MFTRRIIKDLLAWSKKSNRKPLVLRGARQVGKTTVIDQFSEHFEQYIYLNCERADDSQIFNEYSTIEEVVEALFFLKSKDPNLQTLIFIDEIQSSPHAVALLRYFYEEFPNLYVVAAGSLLENLLDISISFPVGRVEFLVLHPVAFDEFLVAIGETQSAELLQKIPFPLYAHEKLTSLYHRYVQIGGMPEAVQRYCESSDLLQLSSIYTNLIIAYREDVEKYASSNTAVPVIRHLIQRGFVLSGDRVKYENFGGSSYRSREVKEAFTLLEKAFLFRLLHPVTSTTLPIIPDQKRAPRLQALDTGLIIYSSGLEREVFVNRDLSAVASGKIFEHSIGQELFALSHSPLHELSFWVRDKSQSNAEVDYILQWNGGVVPIEVKSGAVGRLRSLHQFIDSSPHDLAVRFCNAPFSFEEHKTICGKAFRLISLPPYLASNIYAYLEYYGA